MDANELLKKVRKIEIKTRGLSRNIFAGEYHSKRNDAHQIIKSIFRGETCGEHNINDISFDLWHVPQEPMPSFSAAALLCLRMCAPCVMMSCVTVSV